MKIAGCRFLCAVLVSISGLSNTVLAAAGYYPIAGFVTPPSNPQARLVSDGAENLWGTTSGGGPYGCGTVFKVNVTTGVITTVVDFDGSKNPADNARGSEPQAGLVSDGAGNLWGTTSDGGLYGCGTVFKVKVATGAITMALDFDRATNSTDNTRGSAPRAGLVSGGGGYLWGTTRDGGTGGYGTVFKVNVTTGAIKTVLDFDFSNDSSNNARGAWPDAVLVSDGTGNLWGTTAWGGTSDNGTVFKVETATGAIKTVVDFDFSKDSADNSRGGDPEADLVSDGAGNLWGTTSVGGTTGAGTVFKLNMTTGAITTVADFDNSSNSTDSARGAWPEAGLVSDGTGNLWGTTSGGGSHDQGTVFKVNEATGAITTGVDFDNSPNSSDNSRGGEPKADLVTDGAGNLWGTTSVGGTGGYGTVFNVNVASGVINTVGDLGSPPMALSPNGGLVSDGTGNLWGTTFGGGINHNGTVFKVNVTTGATTTVVDFDGSPNSTDNARGGSPQGGLVSDGAGNLWGTTQSGGTNYVGTVFKVNIATGAITTVVDFDNSPNSTDNARGGGPQGGLVSDGAGNLWGTTQSGGTNWRGTVFKVNEATGAITTVVDFDNSPNSTDNVRGGDPQGGLVSDGEGSFWGMTYGGGQFGNTPPTSSGYGTIFKVNVSTGAIATVVDFDYSMESTDGARGCNPAAGLVSDGTGNLWGTTSGGGTNSNGTVFKVNVATGAITAVVDFGSSDYAHGATPKAALVSDGAGNLWGTTAEGGTIYDGTIFKVNMTTGAITTLFDFSGTSGSVPGANPSGSLLLTGSGFYGTTQSGGVTSAGSAAGGGEIFEISLNVPESYTPLVREARGGQVPGASGSSTYIAFGTPETGVFAGKEKTGRMSQSAIFGEDGNVLLETGTGISKLGQPSGDAALATEKNKTLLLTGLTSGTAVSSAETGPLSSQTVSIKKFLAIDGNGADTFFLATLQGKGITGANNIALGAASSGTYSIIARKGKQVLIGGTTKTISTLTALASSAGTAANGRWRVDDSDLGIRATFSDKSQAIYVVPATASSSTAWSFIAETGTIGNIPGLKGAVATRFGLPAFSCWREQQVIILDLPAGYILPVDTVEAHLINLATGPGGIVASNSVALVTGTPTIALIAQTGHDAPDSTGAPLSGVLFKTLCDPICGTGTNGSVAFEATLSGSAVNSANKTGIWYAADGITPKLVARTGSAAAGGGHFAKFTSMVLPAYTSGSNGPIFTAMLTASAADSINGKNNLGLWAVDSTGTVQLLLRTGQTVTVDSKSETVKTFAALTLAAGSIGAASGYDNSGNIAVLATFGNGTQALLQLAAP